VLSNTCIETFNASKDIDPALLKQRAKEEAIQIHSKESTRKGRTLPQIIEACMFGHASELWLLKNGFTDDTRKYKDLFKDNVSVEVKTVGYPLAAEYEIARCNDRKKETWRNFPDIVYMYVGDRKTLDYYLEGIYQWNGRRFKLI
jgi:hypothetical protein